MKTVFSHIIQRRFSVEKENIATDALEYIIRSSDVARKGMMELLREIDNELPDLWFRTQQEEGNARPDMWGYHGKTPLVLIENKFWAGLTENQPVEYLRLLSKYSEEGILLMVVPEARLETVWRVMLKRTQDADISISDKQVGNTIYRAADTDMGPVLAITSWEKLLDTINSKLSEGSKSRNDLFQLRALCDAAESDAFVPISPSLLSDQRIPTMVLQMKSILNRVMEKGVSEGIISTKGLKASHNRSDMAVYNYLSFPGKKGGGRLTLNMKNWRRYGGTPLWLEFVFTGWGRGMEVRDILEPWCVEKGISVHTEKNKFIIGIDILANEEKGAVVKHILSQLRTISQQLPPKEEKKEDGDE